ncbi:MAG: hypothetical protein AAF687_00160 [Pseudomonadota bacterium]
MKTRLTLISCCLAVAICHSASAEPAQYSALSKIAELKPAIACLSERVKMSDEEVVWSGGIPGGPATSREAMAECKPLAKLSDQPYENQGNVDLLKTATFWLVLMRFGDHRDHLTPEKFEAALNFAGCVEGEVLAQESPFESYGVEFEISDKATAKCGSMAKLTENPGKVPRSVSLGVMVSQMNLLHIGRELGIVQPAQQPYNDARTAPAIPSPGPTPPPRRENK